MSFPFWRRITPAMFASLAFLDGASGQTLPALRDAVEAAWALGAQARSLLSRQAELDARGRSAASPFPGPPSISLAHKSGRGGGSDTARETEVELSAPLWQPRVRSATAAQVEADRAALERQLSAARLRVASEVRELAGQGAFARLELEAAGRKATEALALMNDVERRVSAGESARVDLLQAQSVLRQAQSSQAQAEAALARAIAQWRALTGLGEVAKLDETASAAAEHPLIAVNEAQVRAAMTRLALAEAERREPMEVGVGVSQERSGEGGPPSRSVRISLKVPLGSASRNAVRIAAARAELESAEAELDAARRQVEADRAAAESELQAARRGEHAAAERERLAQEVHALIAKSYRLGESDLPTRLRAEAERFEAERDRARAAAESRRAISKVNQANGVLP